MSLKDIGEKLEGKGWLGVGIGAAVVAPMMVPALARNLRPVAKNAIKGYLTVQDRVREWFAESSEQWHDLVAEAKAEHASGPEGEMMTLELAEPTETPTEAKPTEPGKTAEPAMARTAREPAAEEAKPQPEHEATEEHARARRSRKADEADEAEREAA